MFLGAALGSFCGDTIVNGSFRRNKNTAINLTTYSIIGDEIFDKTNIQTKDADVSKYGVEPENFDNTDENLAACYFYPTYLFGVLRDQSAGFQVNRVTETVVVSTYKSFSHIARNFFDSQFSKEKCRVAIQRYRNGHTC